MKRGIYNHFTCREDATSHHIAFIECISDLTVFHRKTQPLTNCLDDRLVWFWYDEWLCRM